MARPHAPNANQGEISAASQTVVPAWFIGAGLRFFAISLIAALFVVVLAPLGSIRALGTIAFVCATAGVALHLYALHLDDPRAFAALFRRLRRSPAHTQGWLAPHKWN